MGTLSLVYTLFITYTYCSPNLVLKKIIGFLSDLIQSVHIYVARQNPYAKKERRTDSESLRTFLRGLY